MTGHEQDRPLPVHEQEAIRRTAAIWHAASELDDMDWAGFTEWLEADPVHRAAYDEVALTDAALDDHRAYLQAMSHDGVPEHSFSSPAQRMRHLRWAGVAIAASLVALFALPTVLPVPSSTFRTQAAAERIMLDDGSTVLLGPHSSLIVSGRRQESLTLSGGAWFDIRHDPARPLSIRAGDAEISDIGTRFDVQAQGRQVRVAVAEGKVKVAGPAMDTPLELAKGRNLVLDVTGGTATLSDVPSESVGLWRSGRLSYRNMPLSLVAADIARYAGVEVEVAPSLRGREFSGTFVIGNGEAALRDLSQLMDLSLAGDRGRYRLDERRR